MRTIRIPRGDPNQRPPQLVFSGFSFCAVCLAGVAVIAICGCSLASRPSPELEHVRCLLVYAPQAAGHDLEFTAWSRPYDPEDYLLSPPDQLVHALVAPGRRLMEPMTVEGADCTQRLWPEGFRLPMYPGSSKLLQCSRQGTSPVSMRVATRWGSCTASLAAGEWVPEYEHASAADLPGQCEP